MEKTSTTYFDRPGPQNTAGVIEAVKKRAGELGTQHIVVASTRGTTALEFAEGLEGMNRILICVGEHSGFTGGDEQLMPDEVRQELEGKGAKVLICSHALSGVGRSISSKLGGITGTEIIAHTLRRFGTQGVKVAVEIAVMAADAGLIPTDREVIAVGGTRGGCDTAIVLKAAHMNNFFDLEIREIIAKPRQWD
ncbi:MAG: pyruvate kinase alpha/beta domain-containing protein [bacterium]|jgi:hypothetical protein